MQLGAGVHIFTPPRREVVDDEDPVPGLNDGIGDVRTDKTGSSCDEYGSLSLGDIEILSESLVEACCKLRNVGYLKESTVVVKAGLQAVF